jgi:hypothetical protein
MEVKDIDMEVKDMDIEIKDMDIEVKDMDIEVKEQGITDITMNIEVKENGITIHLANKKDKNTVNCLWLINQIIDVNNHSKALKNQGNKLVSTDRFKEKR